MYRIQTKGYDKKEKCIISQNYLLPSIREQIKFNKEDIIIEDELDRVIPAIEIIKKTRDLMMNKNHDYGEAWRDMEVISLTDLIIQKIFRMKSILKNDGKTSVSERIDANFQDILNYSVFAQILLKE